MKTKWSISLEVRVINATLNKKCSYDFVYYVYSKKFERFIKVYVMMKRMILMDGPFLLGKVLCVSVSVREREREKDRMAVNVSIWLTLGKPSIPKKIVKCSTKL